jgi:hypothetical protein
MKISDRNVKIFSILVTAIVTLLVTFSANQALKLSTRYSVREFFPKNHPILNDDLETKQKFQLSESPTFLVSLSLKPSQKGHWLTPERVAQLEKMTEKLSKVEGVKQVRSLTNLEMALDQGKTLVVGPVLKTLPVKKWVSYIQSQALLRSQLISEDMRSVLLLVEPASQDSTVLLKLASDLQFRAVKPQWDVHVAGVPAVQAKLADRLGKEIVKFLFLSLASFCLMFLFFYRNFRPILFALLGLIVTNLTSLGWLSFFGIPFTILLSTLPIIVSITFVSLAIHTFHLWAERRKALPATAGWADRFRTSLQVLRELALPNLLGSLTTAIGFSVLAAAPIPAIQTYAWVTAGAVMWTWAVTQLLLVGFQHFFFPVPRDWNHARAWWMLKINRWSIPVIALTLGSCLVLGGTVPKINFSGRLFDDLPRKESVVKSTEKMDEKFGGTVALDVALVSKNPDTWKNPVLLRKLATASEKIRAIPGVGSVLSVTDFMGEKLPDTEQGVAEVFFLFSMSSENPMNHFVNSDFTETRIAARLRDLPSAEIEKIRAEVRGILSSIDPSFSIRETGLAVNSHTLNQEVAKELVYGFWQSVVIIGLLLAVIFRSVRWAFLACLPNFVPPAILIGTLVLFQTPVKPGIALIFSIALGLAFNNTVYLLSRLKRIQEEKGMSTLPIRRALLEEGNPCFSESFIMLVGFAIFLTSDFKLNQTFGAYMILSIVAGALADLVFLPAILREFSPVLWAKTTASAAWFSLPFRARKVRSLVGAGVAAGVVAVVLFVLVLFGALPARAADDSKAILEKARTQLESKTDQATVVLKIIEPNGEVKTREMSLQTLRTADGFKALVRIIAPADIKGTALLAEIEKGEERQWLYLPSSKQVRRVASAKKSTGVLGSELSPEDLNSTAIKSAKTRVVKKDSKTAVVEVTPAKGTSEYSKVLTAFDVSTGLPTHTDYYVGSKIRKTVDFLNYKKVDGKVYRAQTIKVKNLEKNRGTDIEFSDLKVNTSLTAKDFTESALKDSW